LDSDRLMEQEPPAPFELVIEDNELHLPLVLDPRVQSTLEASGNLFDDGGTSALTTLPIPWVGRTLTFSAPSPP
ncbi:MAG: hypothetical protein QNJ90_12730, partial [Planctomycetota bacterium]|nr:hypothetical protein [Planctomycetota bacterium]